MTKRPRQHWQDDSEVYTFNQYAFYLAVLGLLIAGLAYWYINHVRGPKIPVTHVVSIFSSPGGELPVIPFQTSDDEALGKVFEGYRSYYFNDQPSFEKEVVDRLLSDYAGNQEVDTMLIWLSAIGKIVDGKPVILGSDPDVSIDLDLLTERLSGLTAQNVILLLDCNHAYVNQDAYRDASLSSDFNLFSDAVRKSTTNAGKTKILIYCMPGEQPMYSTMRRRSLFGYAFEKTFTDNPETVVWTIDGFRNSVDRICLRDGGTAAPNIQLRDEDSNPTEFRQPKIFPTETQEVDPARDPNAVDEVVEASRILEALNDTWTEFHTADGLTVPPSTLNPEEWRKLTRDVLVGSVDQLQSKISSNTITDYLQQVQRDILDFQQQFSASADRLTRRLNLQPPDPDNNSENTEDKSKRSVARNYLEVYNVREQLPGYVAAADALSWIFPGNPPVERFLSDLDGLIELFGKITSANEPSSIMRQTTPSLDRIDDIDNAHRKILAQDERVRESLAFVCQNVIPRTNGFQREMAVDAVLRFPGLDVKKLPAADPNLATVHRKIPSRQELLDSRSSNPPNINPRVEPGDRLAASSKRCKLYEHYCEMLGGPNPENEVSRRLQAFAYRLPGSDFNFEEFQVMNATPKKSVVVERRDELEGSENYIELKPTELDLGLVVENTEVTISCTIKQNAKYFEFPGDPDAIVKEFAQTESPMLQATTDSTEENPDCLLQVAIIDKNDGREWDSFSIPIRLPAKNSIDLFVDYAGERRVISPFEIAEPIRPFPNRDNLQCNFGLRNIWHEKATGTVFLYACADPALPTIVGKINKDVIDQTKKLLLADKPPLIAIGKFDLPPFAGETSSPVPIEWSKPPESGDDVSDIQANQGLLCVIAHDQAKQEWQYWIPVFPLESPVAEVTTRVNGGSLSLFVKRSTLLPADLAVELKYYFSDNQLESGVEKLAPPADATIIEQIEIPTVVRNVSERIKPGTILYVDVDHWPRKYAFRFDGNGFQTSTINDADVAVRLGAAGKDPLEGTELIPLPAARGFDKTFGTRSAVRTVTATIAPNVSSSIRDFLFSTAEDYIKLRENDNSAKSMLHYPRQVVNTARLAVKAQTIILKSEVSDYELTFSDLGSQFDITTALFLGGQRKDLGGSNKVRIQFDQDKPIISKVRVLSSTVNPLQEVGISVEVDDQNGVNVDLDTGVEIYLSEPNSQLTSISGKPWPAYKEGIGATYRIKAPDVLGKYTVGVKVIDRVGNFSEELSSNNETFEVVPLRVTRKSEDANKNPATAGPMTHELTVQVQAAYGAAITEPEITIKPEAEFAPLGNYTYLFKGLKGGESYTITAKCKLVTSVDQKELTGSISHTFPKSAVKKLKESVKLILKR